MDDLLAKALAGLPHGPEFRFVDRLVTLDPGKRGTAEYLLRGNEWFLRGHFPGQPIFPGVLLAEAGAQLAGVVAQSDPERPPLPGLKLTAIRKLKITGAVIPGQTVQLETEVTGRFENLLQATVRAVASGQVVMEGEVTLSGSPGQLVSPGSSPAHSR